VFRDDRSGARAHRPPGVGNVLAAVAARLGAPCGADSRAEGVGDALISEQKPTPLGAQDGAHRFLNRLTSQISERSKSGLKNMVQTRDKAKQAWLSCDMEQGSWQDAWRTALQDCTKNLEMCRACCDRRTRPHPPQERCKFRLIPHQGSKDSHNRAQYSTTGGGGPSVTLPCPRTRVSR
jgi:hypothetical protein